MRFYLADQTRKSEKIDHAAIQAFIMVVVVYYFVLVTFVIFCMASLNLFVSPIVATCLNQLMERPPFPAAFVLSHIATSLVVVIIYEYKMVKLIRNRSSCVHPKMAPWTLSRPSNQDLKATIPVRATFLGSSNLILVIVCFILMNIFSGDLAASSSLIKIMTLIISLRHACNMPIVLFLTIKSNEKRHFIPPELPSGLQFYE